MQRLSTEPAYGPDDMIEMRIVDSAFCKDAFNVHGPRDSCREIVKHGPGLHICITQPAARATAPCDLHIDQIQQGQFCFGGTCVPIVNGQTIGHLQTVGPWLIEEAKKWFKCPPAQVLKQHRLDVDPDGLACSRPASERGRLSSSSGFTGL